MIKNSPARLSKRRKAALERRKNELSHWEGKLGGSADNTEYQAKVEVAKTDVANLSKKVSQYL